MGPKDFDDVAPDCSTNPEKCDPNTNKVTMQYAAKGLCDIVDVYDSQYQVTDIRDHKTYWISKLKDGHCWMTQNLDYDMVANKTLYSTDTDIGWGTDTSTSWASATGTIPSSTIQNGIIMGWNQGDEYGPLSADIGTWYWTDNWYESANDNFLEGQITGNFAHSAFQGNTEHGHLGNYYNWSAANAVNDVVDGLSDNQTSICAAGWRLPRVGNDPVTTSGSNNEYARLFYVYAGANPSDDKAIVGAPLYLIRGGNIPEGGQKDTVLSAGNLGYYWTNSSTNRSGRNATMAFFSSYGSVGDGMGTLTRGYGIFVRCLAR